MKTFTRFGDTRQSTWLIVAVAIISAAWPCAARALSYTSAATPYSWIPTAAHTQITSWDGGLGCVDAAGDDSLSAPLNQAYVSTVSGSQVDFIDGATASGLTFSYPASVTYSNQPGGGAPFSYTPVADVNGFDANVTGIRIAPTGVMNGAVGIGQPSFIARFRVGVR